MDRRDGRMQDGWRNGRMEVWIDRYMNQMKMSDARSKRYQLHKSRENYTITRNLSLTFWSLRLETVLFPHLLAGISTIVKDPLCKGL